MSRSTLCLAFVATMLAGPAAAAELRLEIANGLVTIVATDTPLRQILAEWAKVGGTRFVNAERVAGPPVTIQLQQIPEQQALAILLRSVAGYLAAPRRAGGTGRLSLRQRHDPGYEHPSGHSDSASGGGSRASKPVHQGQSAPDGTRTATGDAG